MRDCAISEGNLAQTLFGPTDTILSRFSAAAKSIPNMSFDLESGSILQWAPIDADPYGAAPANTDYCYQLGHAPAQEILLSTGQLSAGQSQYALIRARFVQEDVVRPGDPTNGVLPYYNSADPRNPLQGVNNNGGILPTMRLGKVEISIVYGPPATTGSQVAPVPGGGYVPLYLILLTFGQTTITNGQIVEAPAGIGGYPAAPFWRGVRAQHHRGTNYGQAPQIVLGGGNKEVQGTMDLVNLPATNTVGLLTCFRSGAGDPNGVLAGNIGDVYLDTASDITWRCKVTGDATGAVWVNGTTVGGVLVSSFPHTITASAASYMYQASADGVSNLPSAAQPRRISFKRADATQYKITLTPSGGQQIWKDDALVSTLDMLAGDAFVLESVPTQSRWYVL